MRYDFTLSGVKVHTFPNEIILFVEGNGKLFEKFSLQDFPSKLEKKSEKFQP